MTTLCPHCRTSQNVADGKIEEHAIDDKFNLHLCPGSGQSVQPAETETPIAERIYNIVGRAITMIALFAADDDDAELQLVDWWNKQKECFTLIHIGRITKVHFNRYGELIGHAFAPTFCAAIVLAFLSATAEEEKE